MTKILNFHCLNLIYFQGLHCPPSPAPTAQQHWSSSRLHPHPSDPWGRRRPNTNTGSVKSLGLLSARPLLRAPAAFPSPSDRRMAWLLCSNAASPGKGFSDFASPASWHCCYSPPSSYKKPVTYYHSGDGRKTTGNFTFVCFYWVIPWHVQQGFDFHVSLCWPK